MVTIIVAAGIATWAVLDIIGRIRERRAIRAHLRSVLAAQLQRRDEFQRRLVDTDDGGMREETDAELRERIHDAREARR
jgi:hypothetical protein